MRAPYKFKWLGETSLEYDCWAELAFDEDNGDTESHLGREAIVSEAYNGTLKRVHSYKWNNDFVTPITLIKQNYSDFTAEENRKILKWLTKSKNASFLDIYKEDSNVIEYSILGNWINVSQYKLANGRIVGYVCEFESLTPWAFSPLKTITKNVSIPITYNTMHRWTASDGSYVYTINETPVIGDSIYVLSASGSTAWYTDLVTYGRIQTIAENVYTVSNGTTLTLTYNTTQQFKVRANQITLNISTDEPQSPIYPRITIQQNSSSAVVEINEAITYENALVGTVYYCNATNKYYWIDSTGTFHNGEDTNTSGFETTSVYITNSYTDAEGVARMVSTAVINNLKGETVVLDGANGVISSSHTNGRIFGGDFSWYWLPLFDGKNTLTIVGNCSIKIEYREPIKTGEY